MRTRIGIGLLAILALGGSFLGAAGQAGFAGTWRLDPAKSVLDDMNGGVVPQVTLVIGVEGGQLTLNRTTAVMEIEKKSQMVLTMDGKECLNEGESFKDLKSTCRLEGGRMLIAGEREGITMTMMGGGEPQTDYFRLPFTEEYTLSADGKVLTVVQKLSLPDGERTQTLVFDRA
jgi:hypothetical protein